MRRALFLILLTTGFLFAQGSAVVQVTNLPMQELCPRISPDGQRLAFIIVNAGEAQINITTYDGRNPMQATTSPPGIANNQFPSWFANSAQVAYERRIFPPNPMSYQVWAVPLNAADGSRLVHNAFRWDYMPDMSVNNDVTFVTTGNNSNPFPAPFDGINRYMNNPPPGNVLGPFVIGVKPSGQNTIINTVRGLYPRWDPSGTKIAYSAWNPATGWDIIVSDYRGNAGLINRRNVTSDAGDEFAPAWSPDGKWLAYVHAPTPGSFSNIHLVNIYDGTKIQETYNLGTSRASIPDWKRITSGEEIIYFHSNMNDPNNFNIYYVKPLISTTDPSAGSLAPSPPYPGGELPTSTTAQTPRKSGTILVRVLNSSSDKAAPKADGFAGKIAGILKSWNPKIEIYEVKNGVNSGIPQVYYASPEYKQLAEGIATHLDALLDSGELDSDTYYIFSPPAPLPGGYAIDVDIVVEAPANSETAEEEESGDGGEETETSDEG